MRATVLGEEWMRALIGGSVLTAALAAASPGGAFDVCVEGAYPPFSEITADGSVAGFDIDIAAALCAEIGESCSFRLTTWARMIPALREDVCDAIVASMSDTDERRQLIDFTDRYYRSTLQFVGPVGTDADGTPEAMAGRTVGVQRGTITETFLDVHFPATPLKLYGNQEHVLLDLTLGRLDAVLGETLQLDAGFLKTPAGEGFGFVGPPLYDPAILGRGAAIGERKGDEALRGRLNAAIAAIRADGRYDAIAGRYFDVDIYGE